MISIKTFFINLLLLVPALEESIWEKSLDKDDIIIYTRHVEESNFKEFLAETTMEGTIDEFIAIFTDVENYHNWMPDCMNAEIVGNPSATDITYHMKLKVPFPFAKRDIVQQIILTRQESVLEIDLINRPLKVEEEKKYVRMQKGRGKWLIEEISQEKISIRFQYFADPGGDIPAWLVNSFIVKNPHNTLLNLKELLKE